jgi:hypothetical protein
MPAQLTLTRSDFGIEFRRGPFDVMLDGQLAGVIARKETFQAPLERGRHTLQLRTGRFSSREQAFGADEGEQVRFHCHGARTWVTWLASVAVPSLGISLQAE